MTLISAFRKDESLLAEIAVAEAISDMVTVWWLGQSGFLLGYGHQRILIDPYLSDSLTKKYAATDKPHERMGERVIDPAMLPAISLVTSSHNHTDHLDGETLIPLMERQPHIKMLIPEANRAFVSERIEKPFGFAIGLNDGEEVSIDGITVYGIPAAHNAIDRNHDHQCLYMGFVFQFGGLHIYHSGDTLWYEGMEDILRPFKIDLAFLPINGNDPARRVAGNLNAREAAGLAKAIGAKMTVPCHYDMFKFNTADPKEFAAAAEELGISYTILRLGESLKLPSPKN